MRSHEEVAEFYKQNPNITVREVMEGLADINDYYRLKLSDRELMNQIGEWHWDKEDKNRPWQPLNFGTGAAVFKLYDKPTSEMNVSAQNYLNQVNEFSVPVFAGISGTLDQSTAMAGLVGLGVDLDLTRKNLELHTIKMAYLAFMLPGRDHSIHEIMQSSMTFGLDYVPGPGYEQYIYPVDPFVVEELKKQQALRGSHLPSYYLSAEYAQKALNELQKLDSAVQAPITNAPGPPVGKQPHYFGIAVVGTSLEKAINDWRQDNPGIDWVPPSNLHITIGWLTSHLSSAEQKKVADIIAPILAKYQDLIFEIDGVQMWEQGQDVIVTLKEQSNQLAKMRNEMKEALKTMKIDFHYALTPHIKIGHTQSALESQVVQKSFGKPPEGNHLFYSCAIMHNDPKYWKSLRIDRNLHFQYLANEQKQQLAAFDKEAKQRSKENKNLNK
jgi:2'-5' RNA ligase